MTLEEKYKIIIDFLLRDVNINDFKEDDNSLCKIGIGYTRLEEKVIVSDFTAVDRYIASRYDLLLSYCSNFVWVVTDIRNKNTYGYFTLTDLAAEIDDEDSLRLLLNLT